MTVYSVTDRHMLTSPTIRLVGFLYMQLHQAIKEYLEWKAIRSPRAAEVYASYLERYNEWEVRDTKKISAEDVVRFFTLIRDRYNPPTQSYFARVLKNFFKYLGARGVSKVNYLLIQEIKYRKFERDPITEKEFNAMMGMLNSWIYGDLLKICVIKMLYYTGMRLSEVCDLDLNQIETDRNYTYICNKKNSKRRWVMWPMEFHKDDFIRYLGVRICLNKKPPLFVTNAKRDRVNKRTVERWFRELSDDAGIRRVRPHDCRHGKAHRMRSKGADLQELQTMLGHASPMSCLHYLKLNKQEVLDMQNKFIG
jgi:site-specific recombinase XerD